MIKLDLNHAFLKENVKDYQGEVNELNESLVNGTCKGNDFIGWLTWPQDYDRDEFDRIKKCAARIRENADVLIVCGIGGSYLGPRAGIEMVNGLYPENQIEVIYLGNTFSSTYLAQVMNYIKDKRVVVNVISKSGTTTETAIAFRILKQFMEKKYGAEAKDRIIATTDKARGTLKALADREGYETFVIPDNIGGRFSVITPVGLLPMAAAGLDLDAFMKGLADGTGEYGDPDLDKNPAYHPSAPGIRCGTVRSVRTADADGCRMVETAVRRKRRKRRTRYPSGFGMLLDRSALFRTVRAGRKESAFRIEPLCGRAGDRRSVPKR